MSEGRIPMADEAGGTCEVEPWRAQVVALLEQAIEFREETGSDAWHPAGDRPRFHLWRAICVLRDQGKSAERRAKELVWRARDLDAALELARREADASHG